MTQIHTKVIYGLIIQPSDMTTKELEQLCQGDADIVQETIDEFFIQNGYASIEVDHLPDDIKFGVVFGWLTHEASLHQYGEMRKIDNKALMHLKDMATSYRRQLASKRIQAENDAIQYCLWNTLEDIFFHRRDQLAHWMVTYVI